jgi:hypothetical protein
MNQDKFLPAMLTKTEINWLKGNLNLSAGYQRKIKSDVKRKLRVFYENELPLLLKSGLIDATVNCNDVTSNCNMIFLLNPIDLCVKTSLGRDLDPGPLPYQGNALPG